MTAAEQIELADALREFGPCVPPSDVPELTAAERQRLLVYAEACLIPVLEQSPVVEPYRAKRGISWDVLARYCVGFDTVGKHWCFPIADETGHVLAIKCHRENAPAGRSKSFWKRFNQAPARCGWSTLWPIMESFSLERNDRDHSRIFICEGELKALRILSAGFDAVAPTSGSNFMWMPKHAARFAGKHVCVVFDADPSGLKFKDNTVSALLRVAATVKCSTPKKGLADV